MPRVNLTQTAADRLRPPEGAEAITFWDANLPGFGVRVSPLGRKTWVCQYRIKGGSVSGGDHEVLETLGTINVIPKVADARERARASMIAARQGVDPRAVRRRASEQVRMAAAADSLSFGKLADIYVRDYCELNTRASTATETARLLSKAAAFLGNKPVREITEADIVDLLALPPEKAGKFAGLAAKNSLLAAVKRCLKWAKKTTNPQTRQRYIALDPSAEIAKPLAKEPSRDRYLSDAEIVAFWQGCDIIGWPFGPCFKLLLVTGQRREEVAGLRWSELDLVNKVWNLPASRTKNGKAHTIHLSDLAMSILNSLPRFKPVAGRDFVFSTKGDVSISGFDYAKNRLGMTTDHWTLHDLRRTVTTGMAGLGIAPHVADRVLNHTSGTISGVAAVYNRFAYLEERKAALAAWGARLGALVGVLIYK
jgi:integrase